MIFSFFIYPNPAYADQGVLAILGHEIVNTFTNH